MPHSTYMPERMGSATVTPAGRFEAGSFQEFTVTYTAGYFGIDDTGSIKVVHRFASDMGRPQFDDPAAPNYTTVEATNGAILHVEYDMKRNIRPWDKTLYIKVVRGFLREGDQIIIRFGDRRQGSPGIRLQTFCEETFEFRVLVDAIATYNYVELPEQPIIEIVPGPPSRYKAILPTLRRTNDPFRLCLKGEDRWGNPSDLCEGNFRLCANMPVDGLPAEVTFELGKFGHILEGLRVSESGDLTVELLDTEGAVHATSNPCRFTGDAGLLPYWGDLHGQSEETIGTNSARDFYEFARDKAFLDICVHQGNDFQITEPFWQWLNELSKEFTEDDRFIVFPGWEWSGNTGLGGDRNVLHMQEGRQIHRSSHALVDDLSDVETDATSAADLFDALKGEDCTVFAHIGGRYADIKIAHDERFERSVEVHSAWGTFEWLMDDALEQGYRVGIMSNSDGHKGRPGASHPGATKFGAYGGLTCVLAPSFTRAGIMDGLKRRHHYGTTGSRVILDTRVDFESEATLYEDNPDLGDTPQHSVTSAMMGDILRSSDREVTFRIDVHGASPIERIDIRNGLETVEIFRPYAEADLGRRIRVLWEGSEYRGRGRETIWDGFAELTGNTFDALSPINRYNLDKRFDQTGPGRLEWTALTTGGFGGFDAVLTDPTSGMLKIDTDLVKQEIAVADIGRDEMIFANGGIDRRIRIFRMPDENPHCSAVIERRIELKDDRDNALYVRVTHEDGHFTWSSPVYIFR
ncbi:DUF3604 domain-containing protein [Hwanghaeella grinnelliae]|uniref:DUF3604 domain-containing protein n=1 Tax=Hwanghaeella grinnelliae TaxID=2500179 RepID=A0A3S2Z940_9PROT|nr:DUF3604 domain-containing protein [Hwanghaeella grinnelliae]RVU38248.1 DUF3604 domain-containing protein [Hwanghaeella grinnelliae]